MSNKTLRCLWISFILSSNIFGMQSKYEIKMQALSLKQQIAKKVFKDRKDINLDALLDDFKDYILGDMPIMNEEKCLTLTDQDNGIFFMQVSKDGRYIISTSGKIIKIWDLKRKFDDSSFTLSGHKEDVTSVGFSPCGKFIVSTSFDRTIKVWHCDFQRLDGQCIYTFLEHSEIVNFAQFSSCGNYIVSASNDNTIKVFNLTDQSHITLNGHTDCVFSAQFSLDGKYIVSASADRTIKVWNIKNRNCIFTLAGHAEWVSSAQFNNNTKYVISGSNDNTIKVWDLSSESGRCILTLKGHIAEINSVQFSPCQQYIISTSDDSTIKIWDLLNGSCIRTLIGHTESTMSAYFSPDGRYVISASLDGTIKVWDLWEDKEFHYGTFLMRFFLRITNYLKKLKSYE